jgi:hypothetical protein
MESDAGSCFRLLCMDYQNPKWECFCVDTVTGKMDLIGKKNVNHLGVNINAITEFQLAGQVHGFNILNALGMV